MNELKNYIISANEHSDVILLIPPVLKHCHFFGWKGLVNSVIDNSIEYVNLLKIAVFEWKNEKILKEFVSLDEITVGSDGVHYTPDAHKVIAEKLLSLFPSILSD